MGFWAFVDMLCVLGIYANFFSCCTTYAIHSLTHSLGNDEVASRYLSLTDTGLNNGNIASLL